MQKTNVTRPSGSAARRGLQIALAALSLAAALTATPVRAEYPAKIIKIVVPFSSGGGTDIIARTLAQEISSDLGRPVIIENKPGAGTASERRLSRPASPTATRCCWQASPTRSTRA